MGGLDGGANHDILACGSRLNRHHGSGRHHGHCGDQQLDADEPGGIAPAVATKEEMVHRADADGHARQRGLGQ